MQPADLESRLVALALAEGFEVPEAGGGGSGPALDGPTAVWGPRLQRMVAEGRLEPARLEAWMQSLLGVAEVSFRTAWTAGVPATGQPPGRTADPPATHRYTDLRLVGVGGAGRVYKAFDAVLQRPVALKFLRWEWAQVSDRLLAEARAQARVKHPSVREVFEVGLVDGEACLAMAWVEGEPLHNAAPGMDWRQCTELLLKVCDGVQAAHREGLLHLDLKPANILVGRLGPEERHPFVTDFGLVADLSAGGERGVHGGTLPYASPEQLLRGTALDARCDVHGLGVTLHVVLTGRLPHEEGLGAGNGVRGPVPPDLLRVARRAMDPQPTRRHPGVAAFAADLRAVLEGRPIAARRREPLHVAGLWVRRNRLAAAAAGAGALVALALGAWGLLARSREARRAAAAQRFGAETQAAESLLRLAHLSPPHDRRREVRDVRRRMDALRATMAEVGPAGEAAGQLALGRIHLLLEEWDEARASYTRAWELGSRGPEQARQLGMLLALAHDQRAADEVEAPSGDPARRAEIRGLRVAALEKLALGKAAGPYPVADILEAEILGREAEAERAAWAALEGADASGWAYEPWRLAMEIWDRRVQHRITLGHLEEARRLLPLLERALAKSLEVGRSDPNLRMLEGYVAFDRASLELALGRPQEPHLHRAVAAFRAAAAMDPDVKAAVRWTADGLRRLAYARMLQGVPGTDLLDEADRTIQPICSADPQHRNRNRFIRVRILAQRGLVRVLAGREPGEDFVQARALLQGLQGQEGLGQHFPARVALLELGQALDRDRRGLLAAADLHALAEAFSASRADAGDRGPHAPQSVARRLAARRVRASDPAMARAAEALRAALDRYEAPRERQRT
ncbi:MAG: serine/threonine-protein kinase [Holophagaceae bacterium]